ncbi:MAG: electron transfer flavoprotein subunit alpha/FixB family protein [Defluviitaleaceae bacterium]|nr:electron transfer flavoprotein subunit alpha/FixB family protein [Defluviitaleaceae bacterium]
MTENILVICEQRDGKFQKVSMELIGKARQLIEKKQGQKVVALLMGDKIAELAQDLVNHGADRVVYVDNPALKDFMTEPYTKAACAVLKSENPDMVLVGASSIGRDLAPRIAARLKTGLTADCTTLEIDDETGELLMTRPAFGGNVMATIICPDHRPQMATVRPGVMVALEPQTKTGEIVDFDVAFETSDSNVEILETVMIAKETKDITKANILVSGGRGIGNNFAPLKELADVLGGEVSASRASVDAGIAYKDMQVGQTGKTVRPDVYFAFGISGAVQHTAGMEEATLIFAINKDATAPIFDVADVGIVGDAHKIIPKLVNRIKKEKNL